MGYQQILHQSSLLPVNLKRLFRQLRSELSKDLAWDRSISVWWHTAHSFGLLLFFNVTWKSTNLCRKYIPFVSLHYDLDYYYFLHRILHLFCAFWIVLISGQIRTVQSRMLNNPYNIFAQGGRCAAVDAIETTWKERMVWKFRGIKWCSIPLSLSQICIRLDKPLKLYFLQVVTSSVLLFPAAPGPCSDLKTLSTYTCNIVSRHWTYTTFRCFSTVLKHLKNQLLSISNWLSKIVDIF